MDGMGPIRDPPPCLGAGRYAQAAKKQAMTSTHVGGIEVERISLQGRGGWMGPRCRVGAPLGRGLRVVSTLHASAGIRGAHRSGERLAGRGSRDPSGFDDPTHRRHPASSAASPRTGGRPGRPAGSWTVNPDGFFARSV